MSGLSEGELHVQAMRLVCEALADREKTGLEVDWDVINQQLDHMDVILQGIADQRVDDADEIKTLRHELDAAQAETVDVRRQRNNETDRLNATNAVSVQQREEIAYLRTRLDEERSVSAGLRDKLAEAQQPDVGAMRAFVGKVRACVWACYEWPQSWHKIEAALAELDAGTEPTPVAEPAPCPECERWQRAKRIDSELFALQKKRIDRLQGFVEIMRGLLTAEYADQRIIAAAIAELDDANSSATLTSSVVKESLTPTPVAEPLDAEGDTCPGK